MAPSHSRKLTLSKVGNNREFLTSRSIFTAGVTGAVFLHTRTYSNRTLERSASVILLSADCYYYLKVITAFECCRLKTFFLMCHLNKCKMKLRLRFICLSTDGKNS